MVQNLGLPDYPGELTALTQIFRKVQDNKMSLSGTWLIYYTVSGAHNPEQATSMCSCHGVFTDQFIFRMVLA